MAIKWEDLKQERFSPEELEAIDRQVEAEILAMNLRELTGKTQQDIAAVSDLSQSDASRIERRTDHLVSTLRRYVTALGGQLEIVAVFDNKRVHLRGV